ncbi:MAG TPA: glutathione peroxidase [Cyclobacteriaceae bacterium]|nr:glutathione peroxidase [Cyclobacteriaceae bacterium]
MKIIFAILSLLIVMGIASFLSGKFSSEKDSEPLAGSIYDFVIPSIDGKQIDFSQYKGKKLLIVNTASKCGFTPQYADLQKLHEQFGGKVAVLGFPANNFLWQEPGTNEEIAAFCEKNYGVTFQMFEKISVKGGDKHPLYRWLEHKTGNSPTWNFCKYVVNEDGTEIHFFSNKVEPMDQKIIELITN